MAQTPIGGQAESSGSVNDLAIMCKDCGITLEPRAPTYEESEDWNLEVLEEAGLGEATATLWTCEECGLQVITWEAPAGSMAKNEPPARPAGEEGTDG